MRFTHMNVQNWRNFKDVQFPIEDRLVIVGPNAAGKSNLLDVFRFLTDIARPGGGLAAAVADRGGFSAVRSLFARNHRHGQVSVTAHFSDDADEWTYHLAVKGEQRGHHRALVAEEVVTRNGEELLRRPDASDEADPELLTQTHLEQITANKSFRELAEHLQKTRYFHPVPQIIRNPGFFHAYGPRDPFGSDVIKQMNETASRTRSAWLQKIENALQAAVPQFESLSVEPDASGVPHLHATYRNWRPAPTRQTESELSDGTLRLIGLLWTLVSAPSSGGVLLFEEPELSLNAGIVRTVPALLARVQRDRDLQVLLSTHAPELLDEETVLPEEVLVMRVTEDGSTASLLSDIAEVRAEVDSGLPLSEIVQSLIEPVAARQLALRL